LGRLWQPGVEDNGVLGLEKTMLKALIPALMGMAIAAGASAAVAGDPSGTWVMTNGKFTVQISNCGQSLCGSLVAMKKPLDKQGRPKVDKENPNPAMRQRPLIGLALLSGMRPKGDDRWTGSIYNPDDGRTYSAVMSLTGDNMKVKGCALGLFCKSLRFVRVN
jgi:uncharacterized protein (DUF2147 family)